MDSCNTSVRINLGVEGAEENGDRKTLERIAGVDGTNISRSSRSHQRGEKGQGVNTDDSQQWTGWRD